MYGPMTEYLSRLLSPLDTNSFLKYYEAREHFYVGRSSPNYYADLLSVAEIDAVLQSQQLPAASLNVVKDGRRCPIEEWSSFVSAARGTHQIAVPEQLLNLYAEGATLILNQAHATLPALSDTCRALTRELGFPTQANIYITPRNSVGFSKHSDEHDVFVMQIAGRKSWIVYPAGLPSAEIDLRSGDLLYIPRGMEHAARSEGEDSIHITLGLKPVYAFDLIRDLAALASEKKSFQKPMPPRFAGDEAMRTFEADVLADVRALLAELKPAELIDRQKGIFRESRSQGWPGRFSDLRILHLITPDTVVCLRPGISTDVRENGKFVDVEFNDRQVTIPIFMRDEFLRFMAGGTFPIRDVGGMTTDEGKVKFVTEFVKAGLLRIVSI
jgi:hypothetical protein